jgi:hypothetical protein
VKKKRNDQKEIFVGTYELAYEHVRLYLRAGTGADTDLLAPDKGATIMKIGADVKEWHQLIGLALHEAQEMAMHRLGLSYHQSDGMNGSTSNCHFMMNHEQFGECCCRAGDFLSPVLPALSKAWVTWKKRTKK